MAEALPIKRIVLERRHGVLEVVDIEFDDDLPSASSSLPSSSPEESRSSPKGHGVGSK